MTKEIILDNGGIMKRIGSFNKMGFYESEAYTVVLEPGDATRYNFIISLERVGGFIEGFYIGETKGLNCPKYIPNYLVLNDKYKEAVKEVIKSADGVNAYTCWAAYDACREILKQLGEIK